MGALAVEAVIVARTPSIGTADTAVSWQVARRAESRIGSGAAVAAASFTSPSALMALDGMREMLRVLGRTAVAVPPPAAADTRPLAVALPRLPTDAPRRGRRPEVAERPQARERRTERPAEREEAKSRVGAKSEHSHQARRTKETVAQKPAEKEPVQRERRGGSDGAAWDSAPHVTWYGSDFFGNRTACGQRYSRKIIGVAHKTLPCGTLVQFRWNGITATAPVIDRGPYGPPGYVFDFSAALSCDVFRPKGVENGCFTRHNVAWRIVGRR